MQRREFVQGAAGLFLLAKPIMSQKKSEKNGKIIKPKRLKEGDTIGLIAPASGVSEETFEEALQNLGNLGFKVKIGKAARARNGFLAGTDRERVEDLHEAFADKRISGVWCLRGGYGVTRILPEVNFDLIRKNPKIFIGYSDITALHTAIFQNCGLITFHGPVAASDYTDYTKKHAVNVLMNPSVPYKIELAPENTAKEFALFKTRVIKKGKCRGRLIGGNLSLLAAMAGTPFALRDIKDKILFLEDVNEQPYNIDRMLTQLRQSVNMRQLAGIVCGIFENCNPRNPETSQSLLEVLQDRLGNLGIPVIYGLSFGHIRDQFTLPVGIEAEFETENATMTFLETGVV